MDGLEAIRSVSIEELLLPILIQLAVIITVARIAATVFRWFGQPAVVGEIAAGLILGPSLLGAFESTRPIFDAIFHPTLEGVPKVASDVVFNKIFAVISQLGLIFLLFLIGLEFDYSHLRVHGRAAVAISVTGVTLPFALGIGTAYLIHPYVGFHDSGAVIPFTGFALFMGVAMSITAIPILGRMMMEMGITRTQIGAVVITSAAVDDAVGWILLATVAVTVRSGFDPLLAMKMAGLTIGFGLLMFFVVRPLMVRHLRSVLKRNEGELPLTSFAVVVVILLLCATATNLIGIFAIFGAFLMGAMLADQAELREAINRRMRDLVTAFFLPVFFTYTGLRTDIGTLSGVQLWLICGLVSIAAVVGKFGGCGLAARLSGFSRRESAVIGVMMNTRALMELIVINVGYELGVIPKSLFCMLVIMALLTTIMTTPIMLRLMRGTELEGPIRRSGFLDRSGSGSKSAQFAADGRASATGEFG